MSTITSNNAAYYPLSGQSGAPTASQNASPTATLAQALSADASNGSSNNSAYLLSLSPEAQQYLNADSGAQGLTGTNSGSFTLSTQQQQAIASILAKYKDAPYTQDTFDQIQNDLNTAGLGANQLSLQDQNKNFNPTQMLLDDLNGNYTAADALASPNSGTEQTKVSNYMQQIAAEWKNMQPTSTASATEVGGSSGA